MKKVSALTAAARLMASKRKRSGPLPTPRFACLACGAKLGAAQVRVHKCTRGKDDADN